MAGLRGCHGTDWRPAGPTEGGQMVLWLHRTGIEGQAVIPAADLAELTTEAQRRALVARYWRQLRRAARMLAA